jgi:hypothetical protein
MFLACPRSNQTGVNGAGTITASGINLNVLGANSAKAGATTALPSVPSLYFTIQINGTNFKIPVHNP